MYKAGTYNTSCDHKSKTEDKKIIPPETHLYWQAADYPAEGHRQYAVNISPWLANNTLGTKCLTSDSAECGSTGSRCCSRWLKSVKSSIVNYWGGPCCRPPSGCAGSPSRLVSHIISFLELTKIGGGRGAVAEGRRGAGRSGCIFTALFLMMKIYLIQVQTIWNGIGPSSNWIHIVWHLNGGWRGGVSSGPRWLKLVRGRIGGYGGALSKAWPKSVATHRLFQRQSAARRHFSN